MAKLQRMRWEVTLQDKSREESSGQIIKGPVSHMYHLGLLDAIRNQLRLFQAENESTKMFLGSSQNFPDLKNHIGLHCQEEGPN